MYQSVSKAPTSVERPSMEEMPSETLLDAIPQKESIEKLKPEVTTSNTLDVPPDSVIKPTFR